MKRVNTCRSLALAAILTCLCLLVVCPGLQAQTEVPLFNTYWR